MKRLVHLLPILYGTVAICHPFEPRDAASLETDLKFQDMFPRRPFSGKVANIQGWSFDDRYVAYFWNGYADHGNDIWLYDTKTSQAKCLTTMEFFQPYDRGIKKAVERYKLDDERLLKWDSLSDELYRQEKQKFKEENEKRKTPQPGYGGVSELTWAHKSSEFLFTYQGDIFRWKLGETRPARLTQTKENKSEVEYLPDDQGYTFRRGDALYRVRFNSSNIQQITPDLPGYRESVSISPDGTKMFVIASKDLGGERQVEWINYRQRFALSQKTSREVADGEFKSEIVAYVYDISEKALADTSGDGKPVELWKYSGGSDWQETSLSPKPWSTDSHKIVFSTWSRDKNELKIKTVDSATNKVTDIYQGTSDGEHRTPSLSEPFFSQDSKTVYCLLDKSGWRQMHKIDVLNRTESQVTRGNFETYPLQLGADGKSILASSSRDASWREELYKIAPDTGVMAKISQGAGFWQGTHFAHHSDRFAATMGNWSQMRELFVSDLKAEVAVTNSHRSNDFFKMIKLKPEVFTYKNRNGDDITGYAFLPPGFNKADKHPLFIYVYGGPLGTSKSVEDGSFNTTAYLFNMYLTYVLGYITVTIDPRGQSGYSNAFGRANFGHPGKNQCEDLVDGVKYLNETYNVDSTKVGITGWSFGGFQTQYCMYNAPETFTLGIAGAGPTEWQNYNTWYTGGVIGKSRKDHPEDLDQFSLTKVADHLRSPLLLLHGIEDTNVLFQDTIHVYRKLLQAGKGDLVELSLDPTGNHGLGGDIDTRDRHAIYLSFIIKHWGLPVKKL